MACRLVGAKTLSEILSEIHIFSFKKMHLKMSSVKWRQFCVDLNVLRLRVRSDVMAAHINLKRKYVGVV